ncbi:MAG: hypothetical protein IKS87_03835 [Lachnospiraceae bacterium]|nr:hypothetical protein [Lachnospiraceae bacterium]
MKKRLLMIGGLVASVAFFLAGCGSKTPEGYFTLSEITEGDETVKEKDLSDYGMEDSYAVFEDDGDGYLVFMDVPSDFTYDEKNGVLDTDFGEIAIKSDGKTVRLADGQVTLTFKKSKKDAPEKPEMPDADYESEGEGDDWTDPESDPGDEPMLAFWNDDWYGWWELNGMINEWDKLEYIKFSVLATTTLNDDGTGTIKLWDNDLLLAEVDCSNNGHGLTEYGTMLSEDGYFYEGPLGHADWNIDPGVYDHEDSITIDGNYYEDGDLAFTYTIHLVKWGSTWDDYDEDELPDDYDWYLDMIDQGEPMPDELPEE